MRPSDWKTLPVLTREDIEALMQKAKAQGDEELEAMIALLFLTAGRISEVINQIRPKDFLELKEKSIPYISITMPNKKNMSEHSKTIPIVEDTRTDTLWPVINYYISKLPKDKPIFKFTKVTAWKKLNKLEPNLWPHRFRHARLTECVDVYDFTDQQLVQFAGWTDARPARTYIHRNPKMLLRKMRRK